MFYTDDVSRELSSPCKNVSVPYILDLNCIKKKYSEIHSSIMINPQHSISKAAVTHLN